MTDDGNATQAATTAGGGTGTAAGQPVLELDGLTSGYNGSAVLRDVSLAVRPGEVVALLGANGAGKTTTLMTISGIVKPMRGRVLFNGADVNGIAPDARARLGVAHVPEGIGMPPASRYLSIWVRCPVLRRSMRRPPTGTSPRSRGS